jgi:hypothetical protein
MYQTPYDYTSATNTIEGHLLSGTNEQSDGTLFVAEPAAEVTRRAALAEQIRYVFEIAIAAGAVNVQLGDTVRVTHPRYGFASGQTAVVIGIEENPPERVTRLILWR